MSPQLPIRLVWSRTARPVLAGLLLVAFSGNALAGESSSVTRTDNLKKVTVPIEGVCSVGLADIRAGLHQTKGISKIDGSITGEGVAVTYDRQILTPLGIARLITGLGSRTGAPIAAR